MDELILPASAGQLKKHLTALRNARRARQAQQRKAPRSRKSLTPAQRIEVLAKTAHRCHICGGNMSATASWHADHVLSHSDGGAHSIDNYLPAHSLCNNYRWDYSAEEFQWILKIGVWARRQMESGSALGAELAGQFYEYEIRNQKRRKQTNATSSAQGNIWAAKEDSDGQPRLT
jgi:hypothetical protein